MQIPINPPGAWFAPPEGGIPTDKRITIEPDGRVFGYVALWDTCHAGLSGCTRPPKGSPTGYEYAHQGETLTASGELIRTAVIGGGAGHAPQSMKDVARFYENSGTQMMRVRYGEDAHGLWMAGALWPDVSEIDVARIRASAVSGDWRWHAAWRHTSEGAYDFAGSCLVNIPGFPMPTAAGHVGNQSGAGGLRAIAASAGSGWIITDGEETVSSDDITAGGSMEEPEVVECADCLELDQDAILASIVELVDKHKEITAAAAEPAIHQSPTSASEIAALTQRLDTLEQVITAIASQSLMC